MLKIGTILVAVFAFVWFAIPNVRATLVWATPFAVFLICPLAMLGGMYGMHRMGRGETTQHSDCCATHVGSGAGEKKETITERERAARNNWLFYAVRH